MWQSSLTLARTGVGQGMESTGADCMLGTVVWGVWRWRSRYLRVRYSDGCRGSRRPNQLLRRNKTTEKEPAILVGRNVPDSVPETEAINGEGDDRVRAGRTSAA